MNKPFVLDSSAVTYLQEKLTRNPKAIGVRLMVKATGCQGHSYVVDFAQSLNPEDKLYEDQGIKLIVDNTSFDLMKGSVVKCIQKGMQVTMEQGVQIVVKQIHKFNFLNCKI